MQRDARLRQRFATAREVEHVVAVAAVGAAPPGRHEPAVAEQTQVVRDQVLAFSGAGAQLADAQIAPRQLAQEPPTQRMPGELQKRWRRVCHEVKDTSISFDAYSVPDAVAEVSCYEEGLWHAS